MPYQTDGSTSPCFGEGLQYNEIRIPIQIFEEGRCFGEVIVCLIQYHQPIKLANQRFNLATEQVIAGRIVGRADKNQFGMLIRSSQSLSAENWKSSSSSTLRYSTSLTSAQT